MPCFAAVFDALGGRKLGARELVGIGLGFATGAFPPGSPAGWLMPMGEGYASRCQWASAHNELSQPLG